MVKTKKENNHIAEKGYDLSHTLFVPVAKIRLFIKFVVEPLINTTMYNSTTGIRMYLLTCSICLCASTINASTLDENIHHDLSKAPKDTILRDHNQVNPPARASVSEIEPVDPDASPNTRALLRYLNQLKYNGDTGRVLSGQTLSRELDVGFQIYVEGTYEATGKYPAILHPLIFNHWSERGTVEYINECHRSSSWIIPGTYNWVKDGGLIWWLYNPNNPFNGGKHTTLIPEGHHLSEIWTEGTLAYDIFHEALEILAIQLKILAEYDIPVVIRFIGECDHNKEQWANPRKNNHDWEDFKKFWRHTIEYLRNELNVHNVLWCLEGVGNNTYEYWQEEYIDIAGMQTCATIGPVTSASKPYQVFTSWPLNITKPIIYGQYLLWDFKDDLPSYHWTWATGLYKNFETRLVGSIPWDGSTKIPVRSSYSPIFHYEAKEYYNDPVMINRGDNEVFGNVYGPHMRFEYSPPKTSITGKGPIFNFNNNYDQEGWQALNMQAAVVYDNVFHLFYFGDNPIMSFPGLNADAGRYTSIGMRIRNNSLADTIILEWQNNLDTTWHAVDIPVAQVPPYFEMLAIDLSGNSDWTGTISQVRFRMNPKHKWGGAEIDFIHFGLPPEVSVTSPQPSAIFEVGKDINMYAEVSDPDSNLQSVQYLVDGVPFATDTAAPYEITIQGLTAGKHSLVVRATDTDEYMAADSVQIQVNFRAANAGITEEAQELLNYLYNLGKSDANENKIISGHWIGSSHAPGYSDCCEASLRELDFFYERTGESVGMVDAWICPGWDVLDDPINKGMWYDNIIEYQTNWYKAGGLVHADACPWCPLDNKYEDRQYLGGDIPSVDHILTPGTGANHRWMAMLDKMAEYFEIMQSARIPVMFRPFSEHYAGRWYGPNTFSTADFIKLWKHMYHYYTDSLRLNNILWEFNEDKTHPQYPGDAYVDLFASHSIYSFDKELTQTFEKSSDEGIWSVGELGQGKSGPNEKADYNEWINLQMEAAPYTTSFITWNGCAGPYGCVNRPYNETFDDALRNPWVINRDEIGFYPDVDLTPPSAPENLQISYQPGGEIVLSWEPSVDEESPVYQYLIYRNGKLIARVPADSLSYTDTSQPERPKNTYFLSAENFVRLESQLSSVNITIPFIQDVFISYPSDSSYFTKEQDIIFTATAADNLGFLEQVIFMINGIVLLRDATEPFETVIPGISDPGFYRLEAKAVYSGGYSVTDTVYIEIIDPVGLQPENLPGQQLFWLRGNPFHGDFVSFYSLNETAMIVRLTNCLGKPVLFREIYGSGNIEILVHNLPPGIYYLTVRQQERSETKRLVLY